MSNKESKTKEELVIELYINGIIDETMYRDMMRRVRASK